MDIYQGKAVSDMGYYLCFLGGLIVGAVMVVIINGIGDVFKGGE